MKKGRKKKGERKKEGRKRKFEGLVAIENWKEKI